MTQRRTSRFACLRAGLLTCCLAATAMAAASCAHATVQAGVLSAAPAATAATAPHRPTGLQAAAVRTEVLAAGDTLAACEQRLERGSAAIPTMAIVGASYTAGVGPDNPSLSWAAVLAAELRWNAVIYGVPGAGYASRGTAGLGPMGRMLSAERLPGIDPALVIIQAGHDDAGVPPGVERRDVRQAIAAIRAQAPGAQIALLTVFTMPSGRVPAALSLTDRAIVAAASAADPNVIVMDPLTGGWKFPRADNGLHPTAAGDAWIAGKVAAILRAHGITPAPATVSDSLVCDLAIHSGTAVPHTVAQARPRDV